MRPGGVEGAGGELTQVKFYYHKLGTGNEHASAWLDDCKNPIGERAIVVFFGRSTRKQIHLRKESAEQVRAFYESGEANVREHRLITVVAKGIVWLLQPSGDVIEREDAEGWSKEQGVLLKILPVRLVKRKLTKEVPHVLASINAHTFLSRGTYREITNWGNQKAICQVAGIEFPKEHWKPTDRPANQLLECLSSVELETLVARVFEARGCFVPAHRGGVMADIDLFAHNDSTQEIRLGALVIPAKESISIQVKGWNAPPICPSGVDCLIGFDIPHKAPRSYDGDWLLDQVRELPNVRAWLRRSLDWLPEAMFARHNL